MHSTYVSVQLVDLKCWVCGCNFAVEQTVYENKKRYKDAHSTLYCPNGCRLGFGDTPEETLRKEMEQKLAVAKRDKEYLEARLTDTREKLEQTERQRRAERGAKTKLKKRAAAGVCPCCNRSFHQLARHMATMHPDFVQEAKSDV